MPAAFLLTAPALGSIAGMAQIKVVLALCCGGPTKVPATPD